MFTIYIKDIGGRAFERYYRKCENAKKELESELSIAIAEGWVIRYRREKFNSDKGFYEFDVCGQTCEGEDFSFYLVEAHFQD